MGTAAAEKEELQRTVQAEDLAGAQLVGHGTSHGLGLGGGADAQGAGLRLLRALLALSGRGRVAGGAGATAAGTPRGGTLREALLDHGLGTGSSCLLRGVTRGGEGKEKGREGTRERGMYSRMHMLKGKPWIC
jgi:hypothetical protein